MWLFSKIRQDSMARKSKKDTVLTLIVGSMIISRVYYKAYF